MKKSARILLCFICALLIAMPLAESCPAQNVEAAEKQTAETTKAAGKKTAKKKKVLLAYYLQSGTTEKVAKRIEKMTGATLFRIQKKKKYPSNYDKLVDMGQKEQEKQARPALKKEVTSIRKYDTIGKMAPGGGRCEVYHGLVNHYHNWRAAFVFRPVCHCA